MVKFWWGIGFLLWDIDFLGSWEFLDMWVLVIGIFWTHNFGHEKFFWTCGFGHGNFGHMGFGHGN